MQQRQVCTELLELPRAFGLTPFEQAAALHLNQIHSQLSAHLLL